MANYGIVAGERSNIFKDRLAKANKGLTFPDVHWETTVDLKNSLLRAGGMLVNTYNAIMVLDYGFRNARDYREMAKDFVALQDVFRSQSIRGVKLYLITTNADLFDMLKGSVNGVSGTHYQDVEIFIVKSDLKIQMVADVLQGKHDGRGLFNKEAQQLSRDERLDKESQEFIEDARSLDREILKYGTDKPVSIMSKSDYIDSDEVKRAVEIEDTLAKERAKLEERQRKERERLVQKHEKMQENSRKRDTKVVAGVDVKAVSNRQKDEVDVAVSLEEVSGVPPKEASIQLDDIVPDAVPVREQEDVLMVTGDEVVGMPITVKDTRVTVPGVERLMDLFNEAVRADVVGSDKKLVSDHGVYTFIGSDHSGCSGMVANLADVYAMLGSRVLVVDLDIIKRSQTLYFKNYEKAVREHKGISNSLLKVVQGGRIESTAVSVTSRIDVLSMSRDDAIVEDWANTIGAELEVILQDAREMYDVVLLDIPFRMLDYYLRGLSGVDRNIFVVESHFYELENFFAIGVARMYEDNQLLMGDLIRKSTVVINKFRRGTRDDEGYELNYKKVKEMIDSAGSPYDTMLVAGEIPFYYDWEKQFFTGVRHIWRDEMALRVFKGVFMRAIV